MEREWLGRVAAYQAWLDQAERRATRWLESPRKDPDGPEDIRLIGAAVAAIRRVIDARRVLLEWEEALRRDPSAASSLGEAEMLAIVEQGAGAEPEEGEEEDDPEA